jgi:hypothetical protein
LTTSDPRRHRLSRRYFLALSLAGIVLPRLAKGEAADRTARSYEANIGVLFNLLKFTLSGEVSGEFDRAGGTYRVNMTGSGPGVTARTESTGIIRGGRFMPTETRSAHTVRGHENWVSLRYDHDRRVVEYHMVSYTLLLGRRRQADDFVRLPPGQHVDDLISAELNFAENVLDIDPDGTIRVTVVRRARPADEGPDDVSPDGYRAELTTFKFRPAPDGTTGRLRAQMDLTGFSSWARPNQPAQVVFGRDRHLESVSSSLMLGTTFTLRLAPLG